MLSFLLLLILSLNTHTRTHFLKKKIIQSHKEHIIHIHKNVILIEIFTHHHSPFPKHQKHKYNYKSKNT